VISLLAHPFLKTKKKKRNGKFKLLAELAAIGFDEHCSEGQRQQEEVLFSHAV
jgi:hypothetical protein